jgi:hypothetical protein
VIHFSGGEPTLHLEEISALQKEIKRPLKYVITTNGWFGSRPSAVLGKIQLDEVFVSFDRYHAEHISEETVRGALQACRDFGIKTFLKLTLENPADIAYASRLLIDGVGLRTNRIVRVGRNSQNSAEDLAELTALFSGTCPSLEERRYSGLERVVYHPGRGLTPCCGPLAYDDQGPASEVYSDIDSTYSEKNPLRQALKETSFEAFFEAKKLLRPDVKFTSACDVCSLLHRGTHSMPSLYSLTTQQHYPATFSANEELHPLVFAALRANWECSYHLKKDPGPQLESSGINADQVVRICDDNVEAAMQLYRECYLARYESELGLNRSKTTTEAVRAFALNATHPFLLFEAGAPIAIFLGSMTRSPIFQEEVFHVGFVGIATDISRTARSRAHQFLFAMMNGPSAALGKSLTCRIQAFNRDSIRYSKSLGFKIQFLEVIKK